MEIKSLIVRFDIDTHKCLKKGVPRLLPVLESLGIKAVFFVTMGRQISLKEIVINSAGKRRVNFSTYEKVRKISILKKLGILETLRVLLFNPLIGQKNIPLLHEILNAGHELGLHGGMNHALWQRRASFMSYEEIEKHCMPALSIFKKEFGQPFGFASPGFVTSEVIVEWLVHNKFKYHVDSYGREATPVLNKSIAVFPVNVLGEETVPFIEYHDACGAGDESRLALPRERRPQQVVLPVGRLLRSPRAVGCTLGL